MSGPVLREVNGKVKGGKKVRRGSRGKHKFQSKLKLVGVNCNGVSSKYASLDHIIADLKPSIICLQETRLRSKGKFKSENTNLYNIYETVRSNRGGGGLATLIKPELGPAWISEGDDEVEILVVQVHIGDSAIRVINAYGPQETDSQEKKAMFWSRLSQEVADCAEEGVACIIQMDGNLHAKLVPGDPCEINQNGKLFRTFLANNEFLSVLNMSRKCSGTITRSRLKGDKCGEDSHERRS